MAAALRQRRCGLHVSLSKAVCDLFLSLGERDLVKNSHVTDGEDERFGLCYPISHPPPLFPVYCVTLYPVHISSRSGLLCD